MSALEIPELLSAILYHLDATSLAVCSGVSRAWHEIAPKLKWARVEDLEYLVNKSIAETTLQRLRQFPYPSSLVTQFANQEVSPEQSSIDWILNDFKRLPLDWPSETEVFKKRTQHTSHLRLLTGSSSFFGLLILHFLKEHHHATFQGMFPHLTELTFDGIHRAPMISRSITVIPTIRHITFETSTCGQHLKSWILACQPAANLISFTIKDKGYPGGLVDSPGGSVILNPFISHRPWKHISLPGSLIGENLFPALASLGSLGTLTITGSIGPLQDAIRLEEGSFESLHTLHLIDAAKAKDFFEHITLHKVRNLELGYKLESADRQYDSPISYFMTMARACPNASSITYTVDNEGSGGQNFVVAGLFPESMFESLLGFGSLERLVVRVPGTASICLSDRFLSRAAQAWPHLRELDMDPSHSSETQATLQGLYSFARFCPKLRSLQIGLKRDHLHTVLNPKLYLREHGDQPRCLLTFLNLGCPSVYEATTVSAFLSTLFPRLCRIECSNCRTSEFYGRKDYIYWCILHDREFDIDNLAQTLQTEELADGHELSIDDSDEDYWAYSGSDDESYSSDKNQ